MQHEYIHVNKQNNSHPLNKNSNIVKYLLKFWYMPLLILLVLLFQKQVIFFGTLGIMFVSASLISFYKRIIPVSLGLELISFYAIVLSLVFSPIVGIFFAITLLFVEFLIQENFCSFFFVKTGVFVLLCMLAPSFATFGVVTAGIMLIVLKNVIFTGLTFLRNPSRVFMDAPGITINIVLNIFLFSKFGVQLLQILT